MGICSLVKFNAVGVANLLIKTVRGGGGVVFVSAEVGKVGECGGVGGGEVVLKDGMINRFEMPAEAEDLQFILVAGTLVARV